MLSVISFANVQLRTGRSIVPSAEHSTCLGSGGSLVLNYARSSTSAWSVGQLQNVTVTTSRSSMTGLTLRLIQVMLSCFAVVRKAVTWQSSEGRGRYGLSGTLTNPERHPNLHGERSEYATKMLRTHASPVS